MTFQQWLDSQPQDLKLHRKMLETAWNAAIRHEREICASLCDTLAESIECSSNGQRKEIGKTVAQNCATVIRNRNVLY